MKSHEYSCPDCSAFIDVHGSNFGNLPCEHVAVVPDPLPLLIRQLEGTDFALHSGRPFHNHGSQATRKPACTFNTSRDFYIEGVIRLYFEPLVYGVPVFHNHAFTEGQAVGIVDDGLIELYGITALRHDRYDMEVLIEQAYLFNDALVEFTPLSIRQLADVPALELRNVPGVELDWASLLT